MEPLSGTPSSTCARARAEEALANQEPRFLPSQTWANKMQDLGHGRLMKKFLKYTNVERVVLRTPMYPLASTKN